MAMSHLAMHLVAPSTAVRRLPVSTCFRLTHFGRAHAISCPFFLSHPVLDQAFHTRYHSRGPAIVLSRRQYNMLWYAILQRAEKHGVVDGVCQFPMGRRVCYSVKRVSLDRHDVEAKEYCVRISLFPISAAITSHIIESIGSRQDAIQSLRPGLQAPARHSSCVRARWHSSSLTWRSP